MLRWIVNLIVYFMMGGLSANSKCQSSHALFETLSKYGPIFMMAFWHVLSSLTLVYLLMDWAQLEEIKHSSTSARHCGFVAVARITESSALRAVGCRRRTSKSGSSSSSQSRISNTIQSRNTRAKKCYNATTFNKAQWIVALFWAWKKSLDDQNKFFARQRFLGSNRVFTYPEFPGTL